MEFIIPAIVNFLAVVFILWYFGRKPLAAFLVERSETIAASIREAEKQSAEAEKVLGEWQRNWESSEAHAKTQLEEAKVALVRYRETALVSAKSEAERVKKESRLVGQSEISKAKAQLQKEVVEKSVQMAQAYLAGHLSDKDKQNLVTEYVEIV